MFDDVKQYGINQLLGGQCILLLENSVKVIFLIQKYASWQPPPIDLNFAVRKGKQISLKLRPAPRHLKILHNSIKWAKDLTRYFPKEELDGNET